MLHRLKPCLIANFLSGLRVAQVRQYMAYRHLSFTTQDTGLSRIPINDLHAVSSNKYSGEEATIRCKLAALYRLVDRRGWTMGIYNHITARVGAADEHGFLVNPFGLLYEEVTASNLVSVDLAGRVLDPGSTQCGVNLAGYVLHSAVHQARADVRCALHVHLPDTVAVSCMTFGLLAMTQEALIVHEFGGVSYHDYQGILVNEAEKTDIGKSLGDKNKVLFLRNHGVVICAASVEEAYILLDQLVIACQSQVAMLSAGRDNLVQVPDVAFQNIAQMKRQSVSVDTSGVGRPMKMGQLDFEAWMRKLDREGYNTGYPYQRTDLLPTRQ